MTDFYISKKVIHPIPEFYIYYIFNHSGGWVFDSLCGLTAGLFWEFTLQGMCMCFSGLDDGEEPRDRATKRAPSEDPGRDPEGAVERGWPCWIEPAPAKTPCQPDSVMQWKSRCWTSTLNPAACHDQKTSTWHHAATGGRKQGTGNPTFAIARCGYPALGTAVHKGMALRAFLQGLWLSRLREHVRIDVLSLLLQAPWEEECIEPITGKRAGRALTTQRHLVAHQNHEWSSTLRRHSDNTCNALKHEDTSPPGSHLLHPTPLLQILIATLSMALWGVTGSSVYRQ